MLKRMEYKGDGGETISNLDDWENFGKPKIEGHWKKGRSAYELGADWVGGGDAADKVQKLLEPEFPGCQLKHGVVEKRTRFDSYRGEVRNHDLLVSGRYDGGDLIVAVEGKADEPFGESLVKQQIAAQKRLDSNEASRGIARLNDLTELFLSCSATEAVNDPELSGFGYQLLTGLAGTLADAKNADAAVFLVHEFVTDQTHDAKHDKNAEQYKRFVKRIGASVPQDSDGRSSWITPPIEIKGGGDYMPESIPVSFAKLVTAKRD